MSTTVNIESHGPGAAAKTGSKAGAVVTTTGITSSSITGYTQGDRILRVTPALSSTLGLPAGLYERVGTDGSGNPTYAPYDR